MCVHVVFIGTCVRPCMCMCVDVVFIGMYMRTCMYMCAYIHVHVHVCGPSIVLSLDNPAVISYVSCTTCVHF